MIFGVETKAVQRLFYDMPKILNQQMNRTFPQSATAFLKHFSKTRLVRGVYDVKRKSKKKKKRTPTGQVSVPAKARLAGFAASVRGRQDLDHKEFRVRTSNPLLLIRERGGTIRPRRGQWLYIRGKFTGRGAVARRKAFAEQQRAAGSKYSRPIVARVRQVVVPAVLGFYKAWRRWRPEFRVKLREGLQAAVRRMASSRARRAT
jgi:hypothetical protein